MYNLISLSHKPHYIACAGAPEVEGKMARKHYKDNLKFMSFHSKRLVMEIDIFN